MCRHDSAFSDAVAGLNTLELCAEGNTLVHRLHPLVKMAVTTIYVAVVISFGRYEIAALLPYFFYPAILIPLSETPGKILLRRLLPALPFSLFGGLSNVFFDHTPMILLEGFVISGGVVSFISIMIKTVLSVSAILLLVSTTDMAVLSRQLAAMGVPGVLVLQLTLTYRYLAVLVDETGTMFSSYMLRSPETRGVRMRDMGTFIGVLLLRSIGRAERVYDAMKCRGFNGVYPASSTCRPTASDLLCLFIVCGIIILPRCLL
ncbi:MAG: cobalt ECF transporter T component CbiQ [Synergistaceae bacterium]|jgi:cobalt/nickel transport system permease protein|nr:cobalt ECF transporter T component CbiQ [Synergistaceae bacterium]